jgi:hypothetical protein
LREAVHRVDSGLNGPSVLSEFRPTAALAVVGLYPETEGSVALVTAEVIDHDIGNFLIKLKRRKWLMTDRGSTRPSRTALKNAGANSFLELLDDTAQLTRTINGNCGVKGIA